MENTKCSKCSASLKSYWLKDGICNACRNPQLVVTALTNTKYNGWANYETWNVALWISNDEEMYNLAKDVGDYSVFVLEYSVQPSVIDTEQARMTPDRVSWSDPRIDVKAINKLISEL